MSLTDIRSGLQAYISDTFGFRVVGGIIDGPVEDGDVGCCWTTGGVTGGDAESEIVTLNVRLFRRYSPDTPELRDPTQLEADVDTLRAALQPIQSGLAGAWFFIASEWQIDLPTNMTEYVIECRRSDPFATGG